MFTDECGYRAYPSERDDDFDFGGAADTGAVYDDDADFECVCSVCHEPCAKSAMSKANPEICRCCCPVRAAERAAEKFADI